MRTLLILLPFVLLQMSALGQTAHSGRSVSDTISTAQSPAAASLEELYDGHLLNVAHYINGREYQIYFQPSRSHPLFLNSSEHEAFISVDGKSIKDLKVLYDMYLDEVIYRIDDLARHGRFVYIMLNKSTLHDFTIFSDGNAFFFRNMTFADSLNMDNGYYQQAYNGKHRLIVRHRALIKTEYSIDSYDYKAFNYILIDGVWRKIRRKHGLLKALGSSAPEARKYIRAHHLNIRKATPELLAALCRHIDDAL